PQGRPIRPGCGGASLLGRPWRPDGCSAPHLVRRRTAACGHRARRRRPPRPVGGRRTHRQCRPRNGRTPHSPLCRTKPAGHHRADRHPRPRADRTRQGARDAAGGRAPRRNADTPRMSEKLRILPRDTAAGPLDLMIAVMAFLAALALGASLVADRAAQSWRSGLAGQFTVQIMPPIEGEAEPALERDSARAIEVLRGTPGIAVVTPVSRADALKLVEPWLGADAIVA